MPAVNVTLNGKSYRLACDEGQEQHLLGLAAELNGHVESFKGAFGEIGDGRLTVMAALMVADQLHELRRRFAAVEGEVAELKRGHGAELAALERSQDAVVETLTSAAERVERLASALSIRGG
jgi:cell division protein ZapA